MARCELEFENCKVPADMNGPPELLDILASCGVEAREAWNTDPPSITLTLAAGKFHLSGPAYLSPFCVDGIDAAAGSVMAGLAACKSLAVEGHILCLHAAAASMNGRGYLFIAPFGTGKSSLMAELAILGADIIADDVVLLDVRETSMTGFRMPPRLRRAFVNCATPRMRDWIAEHSILSGPRYVYLKAGLLVGGQHEITDVVLLNRVACAENAEPVLEAVAPGTIIPRIIWHNMSRQHAPSAIASMASALAEGLRGSILHVNDMSRAAGLLFSGDIRTIAGSGHPTLTIARRDDLLITRTDRGAIISDDQTGRIFEINESAFVILTLLQELDDVQKVREMLRKVYPDTPERMLFGQLSICMRQFADHGLIDFSRNQLLETPPESA